MKDLINMVLDVRKMEVGETKLKLQAYPFNSSKLVWQHRAAMPRLASW